MERKRQGRAICRELKAAIIPLVLPYCVGRHQWKSGAYMGAAEAFYKAWKEAKRRAGAGDPTLLVKLALDRVEKIGLDDGLNPEAMRKVREKVEEELKRKHQEMQ